MKKLGKSIKAQAVNVLENQLIEIDDFIKSQTLPIVIKPLVNDIDLADWAEGNRDSIEANLLQNGAILFRGFNITTASEFERFGLAICSELFNENGEHPRNNVSGNVYTPVFYPGDRKLLWHNENSFNHRWPMKIMFGCRQPAQQGGETPIVDSRQVFQRINPKIRDNFIEKQVMYVRNYGSGLGLNWETVFQTTNREEVAAICQRNFVNFEWKPDGTLRTLSVRPAVAKHPQTGEITWFNQAQHWHPACLDAQTRESFISSFAQADLPRNCYYGDGTPIEDSIMAEICEVYQELEVTFPWKQGDVLLLDNLLTAHARNPFIGERKLLVAMGDMTSFADINN
ncbi:MULTISPECIES: TauD/TfdA family dioxygenase [unclassified Tolypothrix]|uniref:TauD/TfdA family dioxygenase n=1 Tax=unclassified Tolypothrix TaxID=2649714 RepID=UPI0005EAAFCD|nr:MULTISPECIES: TauD/TfdA family dioxygenase [unclassified Tolypothrix]BAY91153.1 taurine catabolism dioxygenase TauD/TfdA [Microchaete diplosiphon NIES-3275]EKE99918.1 putative taurine catabolism dioxygenase [Tolypothrix sp. PCC 7601]MBE9081406.1 TauD/TfdA family dioxygenase [Tolypothrix sp. LEGE 11397]UYD25242.1 TauD/TfdA family dioxygenase [Tolypothrix sp. PCC 7712]UYD32519.1 TauD/TfdA family dioxygenase [Tolypothrix sp. PCC 7601]